MLRESKHIHLILWVHHSCILLGFAKAPPLFDLPCEESPWRVNVEIWSIGQCCRNAEPRSLVDRLIQGHDWVVPVAGLRHSSVVSWNTLKHSKTTYLFAVPCNTRFWSTKKIKNASKSQLCYHPHPVKPKWMHFIYEQNQQKARWPWAVSPPLMMKSPANTLKLDVTAPWWHDLCQEMLLQSVNLVRIQQSYLWAGKLRKNMWPHSCL